MKTNWFSLTFTRNVLSALLVVIATSFAHARGPLNPISIGNWVGGTYTNDSTGRFDHCAVTAHYVSGIDFFISVGNTYNWELAFAHQSWRLVVGQNAPVDLTFDGHGPYHVFARVALPTFVVVEMPPTSELVSRFRNATGMTAFANGQLFQFSLKDTSQVIPALVQCVRNNIVPPSPVASAPTGPPVANAPVAVNPPPPSDNANLKAVDLHDEALELATNFILSAKLDNPRVLSKSDTPVALASFGAQWTANDSAGTVRIIPEQEGSKGIDVTAEIIAADAKECKGKFASARSSDMIDSEIVFSGFSSCEDSAGTRSAQYFILPRKKGGFVMFSVAGAAYSGNRATAISDDKRAVYQKAALTAAN
jgi:hypothetical protein